MGVEQGVEVETEVEGKEGLVGGHARVVGEREKRERKKTELEKREEGNRRRTADTGHSSRSAHSLPSPRVKCHFYSVFIWAIPVAGERLSSLLCCSTS